MTNTSTEKAADVSPHRSEPMDLREDERTRAQYFRLKDARRSARDSERHASVSIQEQSTNPHWKEVRNQCEQILKAHHYDIEVACWYTEALLRLSGLTGLKQGFTVLHNMIASLSNNDCLEQEQKEGKLQPFASLNGIDRPGTLIEPLSWINLTHSTETEQYALWQYQQALLSKDSATLQQIQLAVQTTPLSFFQQWQSELNDVINLYTALTTQLDEIAQHKAPPTSNIKNSLNELSHHFHMMTKNTIPEVDTPTQSDTTEHQHASDGKPPITTANTQWTRHEALNTLIEISAFFSNTEPHSPLPYLLQRAVKWGNLTLAELLPLIVKDDQARDDIFNLTGIQDQTNTGEIQ